MKKPPKVYLTLARMAEFSQRVYKLHLRECRSVRDIGDAAPEVVHLINLAYGELYSTTELDIDQGASCFQTLKKSRGRLFPFGWARVLRAIRSNDEYIALLIGVHPDYREKGVITVLLNRLMNIIPSEPYKRRTSFIKKI